MKVDVCIATYNHVDYIERTLISVLSQKTDFEFRILIGDDNSTDGTQKIITKYKQKYPEIIDVFFSTYNTGVYNITKALAEKQKAPYVSFIEGDDYWEHELKLQKQIQFLEDNQAYAGCFHDVKIISTDEPGINRKNYYSFYKTYSQFNQYNEEIFPSDLINRLIIPTASLVVRANYTMDFFSSKNNFNLSLIWLIQLEVIKNSKFKYFNEVWAVYNNHSKGVSKTVSTEQFKLNNIKILKTLLKDGYYGKMESVIFKSMAREYGQLLFNNAENLNKKSYIKYARKYLWASLLRVYFETWFFIRNYKNIKR